MRSSTCFETRSSRCLWTDVLSIKNWSYILLFRVKSIFFVILSSFRACTADWDRYLHNIFSRKSRNSRPHQGTLLLNFEKSPTRTILALETITWIWKFGQRSYFIQEIEWWHPFFAIFNSWPTLRILGVNWGSNGYKRVRCPKNSDQNLKTWSEKLIHTRNRMVTSVFQDFQYLTHFAHAWG